MVRGANTGLSNTKSPHSATEALCTRAFPYEHLAVFELDIPFDIVWECLGFRDWFDFVETGKD